MLNITKHTEELIQELEMETDNDAKQYIIEQIESYRVALGNMLIMDIPKAIMTELKEIAGKVDEVLA